MEFHDLAGFKEPASKLIEAIRSATGIYYEPTAIRRKAKAEADASIILTNAEIQKNDLLRRAVERVAKTEMKRQENIDSIVSIAANHEVKESSEANPENDWINYFFEESKDVSDQSLQEIWGKILAEEVATPGKISRRTLSLLKRISKVEAEIFSRFCNLCWVDGSDYFIPTEGVSNKIIATADLTFDDCQELNISGLIYTTQNIGVSVKDGSEISYFDARIIVSLPLQANKPETIGFPAIHDVFTIPSLVLTRSGSELYRIIKLTPNYDILPEIITSIGFLGTFLSLKLPDK